MTRGDGFAGLCLDTPLCDAMFFFSFKRHCCLCGKTKKSILTAGPDQFHRNLSAAKDRLCSLSLFFFFTMWHIFGILLRQTKQQTILILLALIRVYQGRPAEA